MNAPTYIPTEAQKLSDRIYSTSLDGLLYLAHPVHPDNRGLYREVALIPDLEQHLAKPFVTRQVSHAKSEANVIRGLHAEQWSKLITVISGTAFCALVDVRPESPTFAKFELFRLGMSEDSLQGSLFIPAGFANSVCVIEASVEYVYLTDALYRDRDPSGDQAFSLFDPDLNIPWPIEESQMVYSERDKNAVTLREKFPEKFK